MIKFGMYKHFKGGEVFVFGTAKTPEGNTTVLYVGMQNGEIYSRPIESFLDDVKAVNGEGTVKRFRLVKESDVNILDFLAAQTENEKI